MAQTHQLLDFEPWLKPSKNRTLSQTLIFGGVEPWLQGLVKGAILWFRNHYFYFQHGESTSTASQLKSPASQKSKDLNKVPLLLQDLAWLKSTFDMQILTSIYELSLVNVHGWWWPQ